MYLPVEGLYAEAVRRPDLIAAIQREYRVLVAGPSTFAALLNSLQIGFRTLAIQKRTSEVWQILSAVKTEFGKFGDVLEAIKKKLEQATNNMDDALKRSRVIQRKLRNVQEIDQAETPEIDWKEPDGRPEE
jgi:DNA recombination protein RmuC